MIKFGVFVLLAVILGAESHVWLYNPPSRSSVWRFEEFQQFNPVANYNDNEVNCGREHQLERPAHCGVCGDPIDDPTPRANEHGGTYGAGIIVRNYTAGGLVDILLDYQPTHGGYVQFHLCDEAIATDECFYKNILKFPDGSDKYPVASDGQLIKYETTVRLPAGVTCERCTLRMNYRAGNKPGDDLQETFRHCADVRIR